MRCPVCRADNSEGPNCRRCRADLTVLITLESQRAQALAEAVRLTCCRQWRRALALAEGADTIRHDADAARLMAVLHLLRRDFAKAWQRYRAVGSD